MKKIISFRHIFTAFLFCTTSTLWAQLGETRSGIAVGLNAGIAMNKVSFDPTIKQNWHIGPSIGLTARFTSELYFKTLCSLQVELNYAQLGWRENIMNNAGEQLPDTYSRNANYLQLPMLARLAWGNEKGLMGYFLVGPQVAFLMGEKAKQSTTWTVDAAGNPDRPNGMYSQYGMDIEHRFEYGITGGAGLELTTKNGFHYMLEGRYTYGLSDLYGNSKKDVFSKSNNQGIVIKFTCLFDLKKD